MAKAVKNASIFAIFAAKVAQKWHTNRERYFQIIGYEISKQPTATEFIVAQ
ncbi:MAG: hypothetical protein IJN34_03970 [Clostridia bacterium]|nr:hypothetical protein [Clostridia bacterium]